MGEEYKRPWGVISAIGILALVQLITLGLVIYLLVN
jgi:hypothetical protein